MHDTAVVLLSILCAGESQDAEAFMSKGCSIGGAGCGMIVLVHGLPLVFLCRNLSVTLLHSCRCVKGYDALADSCGQCFDFVCRELLGPGSCNRIWDDCNELMGECSWIRNSQYGFKNIKFKEWVKF
ncbi:hypothetical protein Dimus_017884 [Dionaea muscipula]